MNNISIADWKYFNLSEVFDKMDNCKCKNASELPDGNDVYYLGAKKTNSCVIKKVQSNPELETKGNCIVLITDGDGSVGYANYISFDNFVGTVNLVACYNEKHLNKYTGLFLVTILDKERYKYSYGRKYKNNIPLTNIKLPVDRNGEIDWDYMERYMICREIKRFSHPYTQNKFGLKYAPRLKEFLLSDVFDNIESTRGDKTYNLVDGYDINYIAAKKTNNGVKNKVAFEGNEKFISKGNCIVFINIGDGSGGYSTYQPDDFIGMKGKTSCGYSKHLNKYNAMYIITILDKARYKYCFGRSWTGDRFTNTTVLLPEKNGKPDWKYMENYIKSLPFGDNI